MRFSRTNMRLAAARCRSLSRKIGVQTAEFSITAFCWRNADSRKSRTYERHNAEIRLELFNLSQRGCCDLRETRIKAVASTTAAAFGASAKAEYERGYPVTFNHVETTQFMQAV